MKKALFLLFLSAYAVKIAACDTGRWFPQIVIHKDYTHLADALNCWVKQAKSNLQRQGDINDLKRVLAIAKRQPQTNDLKSAISSANEYLANLPTTTTRWEQQLEQQEREQEQQERRWEQERGPIIN